MDGIAKQSRQDAALVKRFLLMKMVLLLMRLLLEMRLLLVMRGQRLGAATTVLSQVDTALAS